MTTINRTAYPRFKPKRVITPDELKEIYTPTKEEKQFVQNNANGLKNQFHLMLFLKSFQRLGYFIQLKEIPRKIVKHIAEKIMISTKVSLICSHTTQMRYYSLVRKYLHIKPYGNKAQKVAIKIAHDRAVVIDHPADLINAVVEELINRKYELPAFSTLERMLKNVRTATNTEIYKRIFCKLNNTQKHFLKKMFIKREDEHVTKYNFLKYTPKNPTLYNFKELLNHLQHLVSLGNFDACIKNIPISKIQYFASEAKALDASEMKDLSLQKRLALTVCLIYISRIEARDYLAETFIRRVSKIHKRGIDELTLIKEQHREKSEDLIHTFWEVLKNFSSKSKTIKQKWKSIKATLNDKGGSTHLIQECERVSAYKGNNYFPLLWKYYKSHRKVLFLLLKSLTIKSTTQNYGLTAAMDFMLENEHKRSDYIAINSDKFLSFAPYKWKTIVLKRKKRKWFIDRKCFEICVFSCLASELHSLDLYVEDSLAFSDYRKRLIPMKECEKILDEYCKGKSLPTTGKSFVAQLKGTLITISKNVDNGYPENTYLKIDTNGIPVLKKVKSKKNSPSAKKLEQRILARMPERNILDILVNVAHWVGFTDNFGPKSGSLPKMSDKFKKYIITLFAYGCDLGSTQTERHLKDVISAHTIQFINKRHITAKKLEKSLQNIINTFNKFDLPKLWGKSNVGIADGTHVDLRARNFMSESHIRYGGFGGIAYHHISDTYMALFSHFISCSVWEAVYIIEGLLKNKSDIQINTVHADTQGQSAVVFAIAFLLGIKLEPRIRNWKDLIFYRPSKTTVYTHIDSLFKDTIRWSRIEDHFKDMLQVIISITEGRISSVPLLRRLGSYSKKNKLYQAFNELGKVIRTIFLLEYISDLKKRETISSSTNKVESYNAYSQWFSFGSAGVINSNYFEEQEKALKYNDLVASAAMLQTTVDISAAIQNMKKSKIQVNKEDLATISPYITSNIKRFGNYVINTTKVPPDLEEFIKL